MSKTTTSIFWRTSQKWMLFLWNKQENVHGKWFGAIHSRILIYCADNAVRKRDGMKETNFRQRKVQGLFVPFARVGSGDPVRVLHLFHNKYTGYCCIHLLCRAMYNLSLPRLSANYYGLPMTVQLLAAHESRCSLFGVLRSTAQVLYCTCLERYIYGTVQSSLCRGTFTGK